MKNSEKCRLPGATTYGNVKWTTHFGNLESQDRMRLHNLKIIFGRKNGELALKKDLKFQITFHFPSTNDRSQLVYTVSWKNSLKISNEKLRTIQKHCNHNSFN